MVNLVSVKAPFGGVKRGFEDRLDYFGAVRKEVCSERLNLVEFLDLFPDATFIIDTNKKVIAWNRACEELTGIPRADILGKGNEAYSSAFYGMPRPILIDLLDVSDDEIRKSYGDVRRIGSSLYADSFVSRVFGGKGAYLWGVAAFLYDLDGNKIGAIESLRDITEKNRIVDALAESEERYRLLVETINEGIWLVDLQGNTLFVNPRMAEMLGYAVSDLLNKPLFGFMEEGKDWVKNNLACGQGGRQYVEAVLIKKDKSRIYVTLNMSPVYDSSGNCTGSLAGVQDVTERLLKDEELRSAYVHLNDELKYQEAISRIAGAYLDLRDFEENTRKTLSILGKTLEVGRVYILENCCGEIRRPRVYEWCSEGVEPRAKELESIDAAPEELGVFTGGRPLFYSDVDDLPGKAVEMLCPGGKSVVALQISVGGKPFGMLVLVDLLKNRSWKDSELIFLETIVQVLSHVFERRIDQQEIMSRNEALEENKRGLLDMLDEMNKLIERQKRLERIKTEFLSVTSHELRTPITPMKAQVQLLLKEYMGQVTSEQRKSLEMILRNAVHLDNLIVDLLDVSKLETGNMKFIMDEGDLVCTVRDAVETMKTSASEKDIAVEERYVDLPRFVFDSERISQVVMNLLSNAIKFTDPSGKITVSIERDEDDVTVSVIDSGIGISKEDQKKLFHPFVQVDSSRSRKYEGSGLGLAISRGIIANHGGITGVKSEVGKGATFYFTLPIASSKAPSCELDLFDLDGENGLDIFSREIAKEGYEISEDMKKELLDRCLISSNGKLRFNLSLSDLEKGRYIAKVGLQGEKRSS